MSEWNVSTEDKFLTLYYKFEEENKQLMKNLITFQNQLSKDEIRLATSIILKLGEALKKLYDFYRIIEIKKSCNDKNAINDLTMINMKIRNENESLFEKLDVAIKTISKEEFVLQLQQSNQNIKLLFKATVIEDFELSNFY